MKKTNKKAENTVVENMNLPAVQEVAFLPYTPVEVSKRGKSIRTELGKIGNSYMKIAFDLYWFYHNKAYEAVGYKNIYDMSRDEFGMSRGATCDYINVVERFAERDEAGNVLEKISEHYKDFKSSQLLVMHNKTDEELKEVTPDMSVRKIKKALKSDTAESADTSERAESADTSGKAESADTFESIDEEKIIDGEFKEVNRQVLVKFESIAEYNAYLDNMNDYIENALKKGKVVEIAIVW